MTAAVLILDGTTQIVLTPENAWEKSIIDSLSGSKTTNKVMAGTFYECVGGWFRQGKDDKSLILRIDAVKTEE